jgi:CRP-like cAMP-binding protein
MSKLMDSFGLKVKKGDYIFREGEKADAMYMIHKGRIKISKKTRGGDESISILDDSQFFGEMAIINELPRSANAMALEECELIKMDKDSFMNTLKENHHFAINVTRLLSERLRESIDDYAKLADTELDLNLLNSILEEGMKKGKRDKEGKYILISLNAIKDSVKKKFGWSEEIFQDILKSLVIQRKISNKKDQSGNQWLAYPLI